MQTLHSTTNTALKKSGFTLVEVIVVSVIVAVLSVISIMLYRGYAQDARQNMADNMAASAARFAITAINLDVDIANDPNWNTLNEGDEWNILMASGGQTTFRCPARVSIEIDKPNKQIRAIYNTTPSQYFKYDQ